MDRSSITLILRELNISEDSVANIYNYGSWVHGTNTPSSDRDIMLITRLSNQSPLSFNEDFDYFHVFELHKLWNQFDVCVYTIENFEKLLEKNFLLALECIFLPSEFKIKEEIDFRSVYLDKYYSKYRLKLAGFYENMMAINMYSTDNDSSYPVRSSRSCRSNQSKNDFLFKNLFHGFRYLDITEQLIQTRSINDFRRVSHVLGEMKQIRGDPVADENRDKVLEYVKCLSAEYKSKLDELVPTNIVKGTFEAHVTFDCTSHTEQVIEQLKEACKSTKYKVIFIDLDTKEENGKLQQLMTSSYHCGEYPSIVKNIQDEVFAHFREFNILRIKVESLASNEGVPETNIDKTLFWNNDTNYFEFHYTVLVDNESKTKNLRRLRQACQTNSNFSFGLHVSKNAFKHMNDQESHYMVTLRLFKVGRKAAFDSNDEVIRYLQKVEFSPVKVVREFIVYDSLIALDDRWK